MNRRDRVVGWLGLDSIKTDVFEKLLLLAPIMVWFSYYPRFDFGADSTMYFKLTVPLVYVLVLSIIGISRIWRERSRLMRQPAVWLLVGFILWQGISLLWTPNVLRGGLTLGISGMLGLVFAACLASVSRIKKLLPALARLYIITALIMGCLAVLQLILGVWLSRQDTLLCAGCVADQFGFVRPNVFAIEPQFFGSMLLVPLLILVHVSMSKQQSWRVWLSLGFLSTVLVLTLSRGAIFAFLVGVIVLVAVYYRHPKRIMMSVATIVVGGVMALSLQGTAAVMNGKYDQTFGEAVAKSLNQLSLGLIDVRQVGGRDVPESIYDAVEYPIAVQESDGEKPAYDGYVAESTDIRVNLSRLALDAWRETPFRMLAGVGLGGAGVAMAESAGHNDRREIVQNEYVEVLLERGIIGLALFLTMLGGIMYVTRRQKWVWGIIAAFMVQWAFFSGYPSALHIYLTLLLLVIYCRDQRLLATQS